MNPHTLARRLRRPATATLAFMLLLVGSVSGQTADRRKDPKNPDAAASSPTDQIPLHVRDRQCANCARVPLRDIAQEKGVRFQPIQPNHMKVQSTLCRCDRSACMDDLLWSIPEVHRDKVEQPYWWPLLLDGSKDTPWLMYLLRERRDQVWVAKFKTDDGRAWFSWPLLVTMTEPGDRDVSCGSH